MDTPSSVPPVPAKKNGNCLKCGTYVALGEPLCAACQEREGETPQYLMNINAGKRPPYEKPAAINPE